MANVDVYLEVVAHYQDENGETSAGELIDMAIKDVINNGHDVELVKGAVVRLVYVDAV